MHAARIAKDIAKHRNAQEAKAKADKKRKKDLKRQQRDVVTNSDGKGLRVALGDIGKSFQFESHEGDVMLETPTDFYSPGGERDRLSSYYSIDEDEHGKSFRRSVKINRILSNDVHKDPDYDRRVHDYTAAFHGMDNDGDGTITFDEFKQLWVKSGFLTNEGDIKILFNQVDVNGDGTITLNEFIDLNERYAMPSTEEEIRDAFKVFDKDNDGFITSDELKRILTKMGEAMEDNEAEEIIGYIDVDGDGKVDYEEFLAMMSEYDENELELFT